MTLTHFLYALLSGIIPAVLWLMFWLREDNLNPEPRNRIANTFVAGMIAVLIVLPFQLFVAKHTSDTNMQYLGWAAIEELVKFFVAFAVALRKDFMDEPVDAVIYMITVAVGFAALENAFFLMGPLQSETVTKVIVTGNMRFIGATLLHIVTSATIGLSIGFAYYKGKFVKFLAALIGICTAIALHTTFNLFIISASAFDTLKIFGAVWIGVVILMLLFEKVKAVHPAPKTI